MKPILTTTRSLFKMPHLGENTPEQLEVDLCKLAIFRANMVLRKYDNTTTSSITSNQEAQG